MQIAGTIIPIAEYDNGNPFLPQNAVIPRNLEYFSWRRRRMHL
jgi:hypothetical protein